MHPSDAELDAVARAPLAPRPGEGPGPIALHVHGCTRCKRAVQTRRVVRGLLEALPEHEPSELEWKRIDRNVDQAMARARDSRGAGRWRWAVAVPALALLGVGIVVGAKLASLHPATEPTGPMATVRPPAPSLHTPPHPIQEGEPLVAAGDSLAFQTAPATGVVITRGSRALATQLRPGQTVLTLEAGTLLAEVKPLSPGQRFEIRAGDLTVHVVGTAFEVVRAKGQVQVAVVHGRVRVDREGRAHTVFVSGGQKALIRDGESLARVLPAPTDGALAAAFPLGFPDAPPNGVPILGARPKIDRAALGPSSQLESSDPVRAHGHASHSAQGGAVPYAQALHAAAKAHQTEVQACYLHLDGTRARRLHLVLSIQPNGQVEPPVEVEEPGVDPAFADCVTQAAGRWSLPAPGRKVEVSIPYELTPAP